MLQFLEMTGNNVVTCNVWLAKTLRVINNQHFQSTLMGGREGVTKKGTLCTFLIMLPILDDP